jgi:hypothetical protein
MAIFNTALTTTAQNIFLNTVGNNAISTVHLCNYTGNVQIANLYVVPNASVAGPGTIIYSNVSISPYNTLIMSVEKIILSTVGDSIQANCSNVGAVTATVSTIGV